MSVRRNIIITPGISQLFPSKLKLLHLTDETPSARLAAEMMARDRRDSSFNAPMIENVDMDKSWDPEVETITEAVLHVLRDPSGLHGGVEGPLGAELTTLVAWEQQIQSENQRQSAIQPSLEGAQVAILSSHTWSGFLAAHILRRVLISHWEMVIPKKRFMIIDGLCPRPVNPTVAMDTLARKFTEVLEGFEKDNTQKWENTFLMTSGFKSVIPCMTIFSLLYGVEMIYTFEESNAVQRLHPRQDLKQPESRKFWLDTWKGMRSQHWADDSANAYLRQALLGRLSMPNKSFSSKG